MAYFKEYPYVTEHLNPTYDAFVNKLKAIIKITDQIFVTQIHQQYGVYGKEFDGWFKENTTYQPQPFTVTRIEKGEGREIPYHVFYKDAANRIVEHLEESKTLLNTIDDTLFDKAWWTEYITVLQHAYQHDSWEKAEAFFLTMPKDSPLLLSIGPIDSYHDKIFGVKRFYSAWLLIKNTAGQDQTNIVYKHLLEITEKSVEKKDKSHDVAFYIGDLLFSGGEVAKHNTMGWSRSERIDLTAKYGAIKMIAFNKLPEHTKRMEIAMEKSLKKWHISNELSKVVMTFHETNSLLPLVLHEFSHTYKKSPNAQKNLKAYYTDIEETRANTYMAYFAHVLESKNQLPPNTEKNILLRVMLYLPYLYEEYSIRNQREAYYFAGLFWLKRAEQYGMITIEETIKVNEHLLAEKSEEFIHDMVRYLDKISDDGLMQNELAKLKKELFLYGANLAIKLAW